MCPPRSENAVAERVGPDKVAHRESLSVRIGYSGTDLVENVVRYVCEERCVLTVERSSAVLHLTGLSSGTKSTAKKS